MKHLAFIPQLCLFFPGYVTFSHSTGFQSLQTHLPVKQDIPPHTATQRRPQNLSAFAGVLHVPDAGQHNPAALGLPSKAACASSPGCTGHRCAAPCFPRRSVHTYRRRRRGGAPNVGHAHIGKPVKKCIHVLVIIQSRQALQVR